ncbi:MAG: sulfatase-like hydrolase/transferase, partial [Spirosomataceae bacterium]
MTRLFLLLFLASSTQLFAQQDDSQKPPNVIIFFADDLRASALGCYGNSYIQTPTIDSLARNGVKFTNAYIQGSHHGALCAPSRAMLLTSKSYHKIKDKMKGHITIAKQLRDAGYTTYMTGKWHNEKEVVEEGFDYAENVMFGGMSDHFKVYTQDLKPDRTFTEIEHKGFSTDIFADTMIDFVDQHDTDKPFFMYLPFTAPHDPRSPLPEYAAMYNETSMPLPPNFMSVHPFSFGHKMEVRDENLAPYPRTAEVVRAQWAEYAGLITHMDDAINRVIQQLKKRGMDKNTIIVFASDNGLAMGSHGLIGKQSVYEHCMNVPVIMSGLDLPKSETRDAFVYTLDIYPTLCKLLNKPLPQDTDGKSLDSIIANPNAAVRENIFTSYMNHHRGLRRGNFKIIHYPYIGKTSLFNLETDPHELNDLGTNPKFQDKKNELMNELKKEQIAYGDKAPLYLDQLKPLEWDYR